MAKARKRRKAPTKRKSSKRPACAFKGRALKSQTCRKLKGNRWICCKKKAAKKGRRSRASRASQVKRGQLHWEGT